MSEWYVGKYFVRDLISLKSCYSNYNLWEHCSETIVILSKLFSDTFMKCCPRCNHDVQNVVEHLFTTCQSLFEHSIIQE